MHVDVWNLVISTPIYNVDFYLNIAAPYDDLDAHSEYADSNSEDKDSQSSTCHPGGEAACSSKKGNTVTYTHNISC